jgi:telomerase protein component 1
MLPCLDSHRYRSALDTAVKIATRGNVKPIRGTTLLFCNVSDTMRTSCPTAKGIGASNNKLEAALLLGLMCKYSCERCDFHLFSDAAPPDLDVQIAEGTILQNLEVSPCS